MEQYEHNGDILTFHSGYLGAFRQLIDHSDLKADLQEVEYDRLIMTGHSLGGALAAVATRLLAADVNGACYTFGAPPIGTIDIQNKLKTPVYHIINETDIVPRLPNPYLILWAKFFLWIFGLIIRLIVGPFSWLLNNQWKSRLLGLLNSMIKYRHPGYRSYLVGNSSEAHLRYNLNAYDLLALWIKLVWVSRIFMFKVMVGHHSIDAYCAKLKSHARKRL